MNVVIPVSFFSSWKLAHICYSGWRWHHWTADSWAVQDDHLWQEAHHLRHWKCLKPLWQGCIIFPKRIFTPGIALPTPSVVGDCLLSCLKAGCQENWYETFSEHLVTKLLSKQAFLSCGSVIWSCSDHHFTFIFNDNAVHDFHINVFNSAVVEGRMKPVAFTLRLYHDTFPRNGKYLIQ